MLNLFLKFKYTCLLNLFFRYFWGEGAPSYPSEVGEGERESHTETCTLIPQ